MGDYCLTRSVSRLAPTSSSACRRSSTPRVQPFQKFRRPTHATGSMQCPPWLARFSDTMRQHRPLGEGSHLAYDPELLIYEARIECRTNLPTVPPLVNPIFTVIGVMPAVQTWKTSTP